MARPRRWDPAVSHCGESSLRFFGDYFSRTDRQALFIGGAGFDPRSTVVPAALRSVAAHRPRGLFIREERPRRDPELRGRAEANILALQELTEYAEAVVEVISADGASHGRPASGPLRPAVRRLPGRYGRGA